MADMKITKRLKLMLTVLLLLWLLCYMLIPLGMEYLLTARLRSTYDDQRQLLGATIQDIVGTNISDTFQCEVVTQSHTRTTLFCQKFGSTAYQFSKPSQTSIDKLPGNITHLDALLAQNGWQIDRPQDDIKSIEASSSYSAANGGVGGQVPFHKNVGAISCNLIIVFDPLPSQMLSGQTVSPGAINVNQFSCQQTVSYPMLHMKAYHWSGI